MMFEKLSELDIDIKKKEFVLEKFMQLFLEYNKNVNLISKNDTGFLFEKHIYDSLSFNLFYKKYGLKKIKLLDIGTGGGFPSLPIAILFDDIEINAVDSTQKKIKFIEKAGVELGLKNIKPVCKRAEELPFNAEFDVCISRAMAELRIILEYTIPYLKTGGYFVAYKSIKAEEEIENAKNALSVLNAEIVDKIYYTLPIAEQNQRVLLIVQKKAETPLIYPRKNGIITKKPL